MAVCNFPQTSPPIGQASTSCLRKFTIHFRRPNKLKEKSNYSYRGEYGFDWLRDEYIYPMEKVTFDKFINLKLTKCTPLCPTKYIPNLKNEYLKDIKKEHIIKPHGQDYYPAWLSIFACNVRSNKANPNAGSTMHNKGVYLDLQLDEIDKIVSDDTEIIFKPSKPCLKITPNKISIKEFLKTSIKKRELNGDTRKPVINYYLLKNAVKIMCQGDTLKQHERIRVFAKLGSTEYEVGQLMVYQNDNVPKANIVVVNVITKYDNNNKIPLETYKSFEYLFKFQSFNQAMIRAEVRAGEDFDLVALSNKYGDVKKFLDDTKENSNYMKGLKINPYTHKKIDPAIDIRNRLRVLYEKYGKHAPKLDGKKINDMGHYNTYLLFTKLNPNGGRTLGVADLQPNPKTKNYEWGNIFVIFQSGLKRPRTIVHEAAHTFTLPHIFEPSSLSNKPKFHQGYTENYMDYTWHPNSLVKGDNSPNKYNEKMYSFFKWQWDMMRNDKKSIKY